MAAPGRKAACQMALGESAERATGTLGPLPRLIEALDPLGVPNVQYASRRSYGGWDTRTRAAMYVACSAASPIAINVAVVIIHLAAIRFVFLPIGTA